MMAKVWCFLTLRKCLIVDNQTLDNRTIIDDSVLTISPFINLLTRGIRERFSNRAKRPGRGFFQVECIILIFDILLVILVGYYFFKSSHQA